MKKEQLDELLKRAVVDNDRLLSEINHLVSVALVPVAFITLIAGGLIQLLIEYHFSFQCDCLGISSSSIFIFINILFFVIDVLFVFLGSLTFYYLLGALWYLLKTLTNYGVDYPPTIKGWREWLEAAKPKAKEADRILLERYEEINLTRFNILETLSGYKKECYNNIKSSLLPLFIVVMLFTARKILEGNLGI